MSRRKLLIAALTLTIATGAHAAGRRAQIELPASLDPSQTTELAAKRSAWTQAKKPLRFGDAFKIEGYDASWIRGSSRGIGETRGKTDVSYEREEKHMSYRFTSKSTSGAEPIAVECRVLSGSEGVDLKRKSNEWDLDFAGTRRINCSMTRFGEEPWEFVAVTELGVHPESNNYGWLRGPNDVRYSLSATGKLVGSRFTIPGALGFIFHEGDEAVAALETMTPGRLVLANKLSEEQRAMFAAASAAILLNQLEEF